MDCFVAVAPRNDVETHPRIPAARCARVVQITFAQRGRGECRVLKRTRSLMCKMKKAHERSHHGRAGFTRHSRTRMVLTVSFALSLVTGLFCHHPRAMQSIVAS